MELTIRPAYQHTEEVKTLFLEYTDFLLCADPSFSDFLKLQNYDRELTHLAEKYGMPRGRLYLAYVGDEIAGCIALHPFDETRCELKRLYVREPFRKKGIAETLVRHLLADAKSIGYDTMLLDTLPFLTGALHLYEKLGFVKIPPYQYSPMPESIFLAYDLQPKQTEHIKHIEHAAQKAQ